MSKATYDIVNGTNKLYLMSLKLALKILHKLEIISQKDIADIFINEIFLNDSNVHKIWVNIIYYYYYIIIYFIYIIYNNFFLVNYQCI